MPKFLVDTSVWIDFFRGCLRPHVLENLNEGTRSGIVVITDIIRHEILVGSKNKKQYQELSDLLGPLECLRIRDQELFRFDRFSWDLCQRGLGGKYTDIAIAFLSASHEIPILSFDKYFHALARKGVIQVILT